MRLTFFYIERISDFLISCQDILEDIIFWTLNYLVNLYSSNWLISSYEHLGKNFFFKNILSIFLLFFTFAMWHWPKWWTCRLFSRIEANQCQIESNRDDNILVTSSSDRFIRMWSKVLKKSIYTGLLDELSSLGFSLLNATYFYLIILEIGHYILIIIDGWIRVHNDVW